jgi:hypothetical protein
MSLKSVLAAAAAAAIAFAGATPAAAEVVIYKYTGTIGHVDDQTGYFGGEDLVGRAFTAVFRRNDPAPGADTQLGATDSLIVGYDRASPLRARLQIEGESPMTFGAAYSFQSQAQGYDRYYGNFESFAHDAQNFAQGEAADHVDRFYNYSDLFMDVSGSTAGYLPGPDYHTLSSLTAADTPGLNWIGQLTIDNLRYDYGANDYIHDYAVVELRPTSLTVSTAASAPEPAAWALMLAGFLGAGAAIRWRRKALAA